MGATRYAANAAAHFFVAMSLVGCAKANVAPLGSTNDGRRQYQVSCNNRATENGACHDKATEVCGGEYETLDLATTGPLVSENRGSIYSEPGNHVLLIACRSD